MSNFPSVSEMTGIVSDAPRLPADLESEQALLGAVLVNASAYERVAGFLRSDHFENAVHGRVYDAIGELIGEGAKPDPLLVTNKIGDDPVLVVLGGTASFVARLVLAAGSASNVVHYGRSIRDAALRRTVMQGGQALAEAALDPLRPIGEIVDGIVTDLRRAFDDASTQDGLRVIHFDDMQMQRDGNYLVKGLLGSTGMAVIYGAPGSGKTFFALRLGLRVAAGMPFFGRRTRRRGVVYLAAEAGRSIENRVAAQRSEFPAGTPFVAVTSPIDLCSSEADVTRLVTRLRGLDLGVEIGLIIIDTLSRVMAGGNENAPDDMGALVRNCDRLREETGCFLAIVHHSGKDAAKGARGHNLLLAATDTEIEITRDEDAQVSTARVTKQRDLPTDGSFAFGLRLVEIGVDEDGDPITSCTLDENVTPCDAPPKREKPLTGAAAAGMQQLLNCIALHGTEPIENTHIPKGVTCVTLDLWKSWLIAASIINPDGNPREEFRRIRVTLLGRKTIGIWGTYVWASHASHAVTPASHVTGRHTVTSVTSPTGRM